MFIIEGNIGVGKTTFLKLINQYLTNVSISLEPVSQWNNTVGGESLLANFYENPKRWAFSMELATLMHRIKDNTIEQNNKNIVLMERSIYSGYYCFAYNGYASGFMSPVEWKIYKQWFDYLSSRCHKPSGFIYLKIDPEIALERIKKRSRNGESSISLLYLKDLNQKYEQFLTSRNNIFESLVNVPVLTLDCNQDFEFEEKIMKEFAQKTSEFINSKTIISIQNPLHTSTSSV